MTRAYSFFFFIVHASRIQSRSLKQPRGELLEALPPSLVGEVSRPRWL